MSDLKLEFATRLNQSMSEKGFQERGRAALLSKKFDVSPKAASKWLNGETIPKYETLIEMATWLGKRYEWLSSGQESDIISRTSNDLDLSSIALITYAPLISWDEASSWNDMESIKNIKEKELIPLVPGASNNSFYLEVMGMSNAPHFEEGERICIDPSYKLSDIQTGEMVVVECDGKTQFKALIAEPDGYFLRSLNPAWADKITDFCENCRLIGKYVGSFKPSRKYFF
ncbi:S24 family peptidase [Acinetobacter pittii]|uniref:helix-turn-helix domain-containing protein n=1 Tax=Acinetobacter pittii TaxID=48296 RepID=UPI0038929087